MSVIENTTVISNFASICQLDLLRCLYTVVYISTDVYQEIHVGLEEGYQFYEAVEQSLYPEIDTGWIHLTSLEDEQELRIFSSLPAHLHRGEASCLAISKQRGWLFLTDDQAARQEAARQGVRLSGTIGSLVLAVERGICTLGQGNSWLTDMIQRGYRSPVNDLAPLIG